MKRTVGWWMVLMLVLWGPPLRAESPSLDDLVSRYTIEPLRVDLSGLTPREREMVPPLLRAARLVDGLFWLQTVGERDALFSLPWTPVAEQLLRIHYGPWDRMEENRPFLPGIAPKPPGARYYPPDLRREELEKAAVERPGLKDPFSLVRRNPDGGLRAVPYHQAFAATLEEVAAQLRLAAGLSEDPALARYLQLRAEALLTDRFRESDRAWMALKSNRLDLILGPIESYDDGLMGLKSAYEGVVLLRDPAWSGRLERITGRLGWFQGRLPVPPAYRAETPGSDGDLGVYDALIMTGDAAATRAIAYNLPNDEQVQLEKGSRRLQVRNAMRAKFDRIQQPMARELMEPEQLPRVTFEAFFANTLFHEVAHGLGVKKTLDGGGVVSEVLGADGWMMEEGKADALSLLIGDLDAEAEPGADYAVEAATRYVTEFASLFRSIRFGAGSSHARANLIRFNFLREQGAFIRSDAGRYRVEIGPMREATRQLAERILRLQGDGDLQGVKALERRYGVMGAELRADLARVEAAAIPVDVVFQACDAGGE